MVKNKQENWTSALIDLHNLCHGINNNRKIEILKCYYMYLMMMVIFYGAPLNTKNKVRNHCSSSKRKRLTGCVLYLSVSAVLRKCVC